ncbi:MAG TPA: response regulator [Polyangia bacterium]|jgi:CheY-like chemotaxis protein|nr:response regulator [Polyangia bacterium]
MTDEVTDCQRTVLVVDDDASIRESLADLLGDEGYRVKTATNGAEALGLLRPPAELRPCVILLDLMMPIMNGHQFYAEQQRDPALASIPIVVISADSNVAEKAPAFGGEYLSKPVRLETVLGVLDRHCV